MLYCRCRNSDVAHVQSIMHDAVGDNKQSSCDGFVQLSTRYHKSSRSAESKSLLLPIVGAGVSVGAYNWIEQWVSVRKQAGLPVSGNLDGPVQPAPHGSAWYKRPLDSTETARILRQVLQCEDDDLLSHSLNTTALSWAAKGNVAKEHRRILGRHMSSIKDSESDSIYSRDLLVAPVRPLSAVIRLIQEGVFYPDNPRSNFYPHGEVGGPGTPNPVFQPRTPVFTGSRPMEEMKAQSQTFQGPDEFVESLLQTEQFEEVKEELNQGIQVDELVDLVSESASDSDTSSFNSDFEDSDVDEPESGDYDCLKPPSKRARLLVEYTKEDAFVRNNRSKIIHCIPGLGDQVSQSVYSNGNLMQQNFAACGRSTASNYSVVHEIADWTAKCRVCFKGKRGLALEE